MTESTDHDESSASTTEHPTDAEQGGDRDWHSAAAEQSEQAHPGGDPDLVSLVQMANAFGLEQGVVLTLPGQVLSGTLVGGKTYFDELATAVQGADPDETLRGALAAGYRRRGQDFEGWGAGSKLGDLDPGGPEGKDLAPLPQVAYLHLRDVSVVTWPSSGQRLPQWRGRVGDVVGWTVGTFEDAASPA